MIAQGPGGLAGLRGPTGAGDRDRVRPGATHASANWPAGTLPAADRLILASAAVGLIAVVALVTLGLLAVGAAFILNL